MKSIKRMLLATIFSVFFSSVIAADGFVVKRIQVRGLQNLAPSTVLNYLPIHSGQRFDRAKSSQILAALYETGFFYTVSIAKRSDDTLIVKVKERPMISLVKLVGNEEISDDRMLPVLKKMGVAAGNTLDEMKLKLFDQSLMQQYAMMGFAASTVHSSLQKLSHNRVEVRVNIREGKIIKVGGITFSGNHHFSASKLRDQFELTSSGITTFFSHKDRFSEVRLAADLERLSDFYSNHGFVRFKIVSKAVVFSSDRKQAFIHIVVSEGPVYTLTGFKITGEVQGYQDQLKAVAKLAPGEIFSRSKVMSAQKAISTFLEDKAYAFVTVSVIPQIDDSSHTIAVSFSVFPGQRVYVRHIGLTGNYSTDEAVLRREILQMEAAPYSKTRVTDSKRQLLMLPYFADVTVSQTRVANAHDQVDLTYHVTERPSGKASVQGGWSSALGFLYGASISQPNFMGTGNAVSLSFQNSQDSQNYSFSYNNPYYTWYGVSRGFAVFYNHTRFDKDFNFAPYSIDKYGATLSYSLPLSRFNDLGLSVGYTHLGLSRVYNDLNTVNGVVNGSMARSVIDFLHGSLNNNAPSLIDKHYNVTNLTLTWTYNTLDRFMMPTKGLSEQLSLDVGIPVFGSSSLRYYQIGNNVKAYLPLSHGFVLNLLSTIGYGAGYGKSGKLFPFFYNYYAGGIGTVPGYRQNSLGPEYVEGSRYYGSALGGNLLTTAGAHLILPNFISEKLRLALTFDAGNVFQSSIYHPDTTEVDKANTGRKLIVKNDPFAIRNLRMSAGVLAVWNLPMLGPVDLSFAFPLNKRSGDSQETFQFAMGVSF